MKIFIHKNDKKVELVENLVRELDDLYDELTYDVEEKELVCIKSKITIRRELLNRLIP